MKAIQAVKKMVALGMGLTMVGATIFGASAAKLSDYPAPFVVNGTPASNLAVIVGDQADGADVIGAVDIIQSLQSMAVVKSAGAGTGPSQLVVEGGRGRKWFLLQTFWKSASHWEMFVRH